MAVELGQDAPAVVLVINIGQQVERLVYPAQLAQRAGQRGRALALVEGRSLWRSERTSSEALIAPIFNEPATRSRSSQLSTISRVLIRFRAREFKGP